jgi:hypothetical protein
MSAADVSGLAMTLEGSRSKVAFTGLLSRRTAGGPLRDERITLDVCGVGRKVCCDCQCRFTFTEGLEACALQ